MKVLKADEQLKVFVKKFKDKFGNDAKVDGAPQWSLSDEELGKIESAADGMSCVLTPSGKAGGGVVNMLADADLGEGVKPLIGSYAFIVEAGSAVAVELDSELVAAPVEEPKQEEPQPEEPKEEAPVEAIEQEEAEELVESGEAELGPEVEAPADEAKTEE